MAEISRRKLIDIAIGAQIPEEDLRSAYVADGMYGRACVGICVSFNEEEARRGVGHGAEQGRVARRFVEVAANNLDAQGRLALGERHVDTTTVSDGRAVVYFPNLTVAD